MVTSAVLRDMEPIGDDAPITPTPPYGATVIVYRETAAGREFLVLHRSHYGPDYAGDWAWGPPSGERLPDEAFDRCAERELIEETGLRLVLQKVGTEPWDWLVYLAKAPEDATVLLSPEHDRYVWLPIDQATSLVTPDEVCDQLVRATSLIDASV